MRLTITIDTGYSAFTDNATQEVARILTEGAERLQSIGLEHARPGESQELFSAQDSNGNTVGAFTVRNPAPLTLALSHASNTNTRRRAY